MPPATRATSPPWRSPLRRRSDGLEIEVHDDPSHAWSDGAQALTPDMFDELMERIRIIRGAIAPERA